VTDPARLGILQVRPEVAHVLLDLALRALDERRRRDGAPRVPDDLLDALHRLNEIAAGRLDEGDRCEVASALAGPVMLGLSVRAAAQRLGCSPQWVRCLLGAGRLRGHRTGGVWVVDPDDLERYSRGGNAA
jgi:excisionase family DNA binding protein